MHRRIACLHWQSTSSVAKYSHNILEPLTHRLFAPAAPPPGGAFFDPLWIFNRSGVEALQISCARRRDTSSSPGTPHGPWKVGEGTDGFMRSPDSVRPIPGRARPSQSNARYKGLLTGGSSLCPAMEGARVRIGFGYARIWIRLSRPRKTKAG